MAHYKRRRCRYKGKHRRVTESFWRKRHGLYPIKIDWTPRHYLESEWQKLWPDGKGHCTKNWPRWHDIIYHTRPRRHKERIKCIQIVKGSVEPDEALFPLEKKPHTYYW